MLVEVLQAAVLPHMMVATQYLTTSLQLVVEVLGQDRILIKMVTMVVLVRVHQDNSLVLLLAVQQQTAQTELHITAIAVVMDTQAD